MRDKKVKNSKRNSKGAKGGELNPVEVNDKFAHIQPVQAVPLEVIVYDNFEKSL